jgi:hypothetical protein
MPGMKVHQIADALRPEAIRRQRCSVKMRSIKFSRILGSLQAAVIFNRNSGNVS